MNEKRFIPGTKPGWGKELRDDEYNGLVDKNGYNCDYRYNNQYNFDEPMDPEDIDDAPDFDPEAAKKAREEALKAEKSAKNP